MRISVRKWSWVAILGASVVLGGSAALAQDEEEGGCVFDREVFPEGYEMCQGGSRKRCEDGAWADVGDCPREAMPPPRSGGGDVEMEPE
jgi:hypothetical protein